MNMFGEHEVPSLEEISSSAYYQLQRSRIVNHSHLSQYDPDFDSGTTDKYLVDSGSDQDHLEHVLSFNGTLRGF